VIEDLVSQPRLDAGARDRPRAAARGRPIGRIRRRSLICSCPDFIGMPGWERPLELLNRRTTAGGPARRSPQVSCRTSGADHGGRRDRRAALRRHVRCHLSGAVPSRGRWGEAALAASSARPSRPPPCRPTTTWSGDRSDGAARAQAATDPAMTSVAGPARRRRARPAGLLAARAIDGRRRRRVAVSAGSASRSAARRMTGRASGRIPHCVAGFAFSCSRSPAGRRRRSRCPGRGHPRPDLRCVREHGRDECRRRGWEAAKARRPRRRTPSSRGP